MPKKRRAVTVNKCAKLTKVEVGNNEGIQQDSRSTHGTCKARSVLGSNARCMDPTLGTAEERTNKLIDVIIKLLNLVSAVPEDLCADIQSLGLGDVIDTNSSGTRGRPRTKSNQRKGDARSPRNEQVTLYDSRLDTTNEENATVADSEVEHDVSCEDSRAHDENLASILPSKSRRTLKYKCCKQCPDVFDSEADLRAHRWKHHPGDRRWSCKLCNTMYLSTREKLFHFRALHRQDTASSAACICDVCGAEKSSMESLRTHMQIHADTSTEDLNTDDDVPRSSPKSLTSSAKVQCDLCGALIAKTMLKRHLNHHTKPLACELCDEKFTDQRTLDLHKLRKHDDLSKANFQCDTCSMYFSTKQQYVTHQDVHKDVHDVTCSECGKKFTSRRYLQTHMVAMHKEKQYKCELCDKRYAFKTELRNHTTFFHEKQKRPGYCSTCKLKFSSQTEANAHHREHHGEDVTLNMYTCCYCAKQFNKRYRYRTHLRAAHAADSSISEDNALVIQPPNSYKQSRSKTMAGKKDVISEIEFKNDSKTSNEATLKQGENNVIIATEDPDVAMVAEDAAHGTKSVTMYARPGKITLVTEDGEEIDGTDLQMHYLVQEVEIE